jgi:hypothetical protein
MSAEFNGFSPGPNSSAGLALFVFYVSFPMCAADVRRQIQGPLG